MCNIWMAIFYSTLHYSQQTLLATTLHTKDLLDIDNIPMLAKEYHTYLKLERGLSPNSVSAYEQDLQRLQSYMDKHHIDIVKAKFEDLQAFIYE